MLVTVRSDGRLKTIYRKWGASPNAWYVTLLAEKPNLSTSIRTWLSEPASCGMGDDTKTGS